MKPDNYPLHPPHLWEHFYQFTQVPRPSKQEAAIRSYVTTLAEASGCEWKTDTEGNVVVYVPASPGRETRPTVIVQNNHQSLPYYHNHIDDNTVVYSSPIIHHATHS